MRQWALAALLFCACGAREQPALIARVTLPPEPDSGAAAVAPPPSDAGTDPLSQCTAPGIDALFENAEPFRKKMKPKPVTLDPLMADAGGWEGAFGRARALFQAQRWNESALAFRPIAMDPSAGDLALFATTLYLESLNVLGSAGRAGCYETMQVDVPVFWQMHCAKNPNAARDQCEILARIDADLLRFTAEHDLQAAVDAGDSKGMEKIADRYLALYDAYCVKTHVMERCDEALYNAGIVLLRTNRTARAYAVFQTMQKQMPKSELTKKLACQLSLADAGPCR